MDKSDSRLAVVVLGIVLTLFGGKLHAAGAIYLGTTTGPYKSTDNGATFVPLAAKIGINPHPFLRGVPDIASIAIDPRDSQVVYMVAGFNRGLAIGLLKTTDGGETWTAVPLPDVKNGGGLLIDPVAENVLYIHDLGSSAFRSMDGGASWQPLTPPRTAAGKFRHLNTDSRVGRVLYMNGDDEQVFKSSDYGSTWARLARLPGLRQGDMFVDPRNNRHLILTGAGPCTDGTAGCGPYRSTDGGVTWTVQQLRRRSDSALFGEVVYDPKTDKLYLSASLSGLGPAMLGSPDGKGWMPLSNDPQFEGRGGGLGAAPLAVDGKEGLALYTFSNNISRDRPRNRVIKSTDGGVTWVAQSGVIAVCPDNPEKVCPESTEARINAIATPVATPDAVQNVSTASYVGGAFSPESIVSVFGADLAPGTESGDGKTTSLLGTSVTIIDSAGASRPAPLFFVSPGQINYLLPSGAAMGAATVRIDRGTGAPLEQTVQVTDIAPGIFTLNSAGLAAAGLLRVSGAAQTAESVYAVDAAGAVGALPINMGPAADQIYLTLYGTGLRAAATAGTTMTINGVDVPVQYAGAQGAFVGLDQINLLLPRSLAGAGTVELVVKANGLPANTVYLRFQ